MTSSREAGASYTLGRLTVAVGEGYDVARNGWRPAAERSLASAQYEKTPAQVDQTESYLHAAVPAAVSRLRGETQADPDIEI